jgi:hypothetical protein
MDGKNMRSVMMAENVQKGTEAFEDDGYRQQ